MVSSSIHGHLSACVTGRHTALPLSLSPNRACEIWVLPIGRSRGIMPHTCSGSLTLRLVAATCMALSESDTGAKLIGPAVHKRCWTEDLICQKEMAGSIDVIGNKPRRRSKGRIACTLRAMVNPNTQPVAVAFIDATRDELPLTRGMEQGKAFLSRRLNVPRGHRLGNH